MKNDYLYAVATIRANEVSLLKDTDLAGLITAPDYKKAAQLIADKGYIAPNGTDYSSALDEEIKKTWELLQKSAPEAEALKLFIIKNDFQNLKAILKAEVSNHNAEDFFVAPCVTPASVMKDLILERKFDLLPDFIREGAKKSYEVLVQTKNGQYCDITADYYALKCILELSKSSGDAILSDFAENFVAVSNIKTAYRALKTNKPKGFYEQAICECESLSKNDLISAAMLSENDFYEYVKNAGYENLVSAVTKGSSAFEKQADDKLMSIMKKAKMTAFGIAPLAAYFYARETEIKCVRIILSAKLSGGSEETVRERMRELYV